MNSSDQIEAERTSLRTLQKILISLLRCPVGEGSTWLNGFERGHNLAIRSILEMTDTHPELFR